MTLLEYLLMSVTSIDVKLLEQLKDYQYNKLAKEFSKLYCRHFELIQKHHISLKKLYVGGMNNCVFLFQLDKNSGCFGNLKKKLTDNPCDNT